MAVYDLGDVVPLTATFTATSTTTTLTILLPDQTTVTASTTSVDNKTWTASYTPTIVGGYWYRFAGTVGASAQEGTFTVRPEKVLGPAALYVLTRDEALSAIATNSGTTQVDPDAIDRMIAGISRLLDRKCGPVVKRTITAEAHDGGNGSVKLYYAPVATVTSVAEYWFNASHTLLEEVPGGQATFQFRLNPRQGMLYRREVGFDRPFFPGRLNVITTYVAGRYDTTALVDDQFKEAAALTFASLWRPQYGMRGPDAPPLAVAPFALPNAAKEILHGELLMTGMGIA